MKSTVPHFTILSLFQPFGIFPPNHTMITSSVPVNTEEYLLIFLMTVAKYSSGNSELGCAKSALEELIQSKLAFD